MTVRTGTLTRRPRKQKIRENTFAMQEADSSMKLPHERDETEPGDQREPEVARGRERR